MRKTYKSMTLEERAAKRRQDEMVSKLKQQIYHLRRKLKKKTDIIQALSRSDVQ